MASKKLLSYQTKDLLKQQKVLAPSIHPNTPPSPTKIIEVKHIPFPTVPASRFGHLTKYLKPKKK